MFENYYPQVIESLQETGPENQRKICLILISQVNTGHWTVRPDIATEARVM